MSRSFLERPVWWFGNIVICDSALGVCLAPTSTYPTSHTQHPPAASYVPFYIIVVCSRWGYDRPSSFPDTGCGMENASFFGISGLEVLHTSPNQNVVVFVKNNFQAACLRGRSVRTKGAVRLAFSARRFFSIRTGRLPVICTELSKVFSEITGRRKGAFRK